MLGRFICPAARLKELSAFREDIVRCGPLRLAVLGRGGKNVPEFMANLQLDLDDIGNLPHVLGDGTTAQVETLEVKLPPVIVDENQPSESCVDPAAVAGFMSSVVRHLDAVKTIPFFECPWPDPQGVDAFGAGLRLVGAAGRVETSLRRIAAGSLSDAGTGGPRPGRVLLGRRSVEGDGRAAPSCSALRRWTAHGDARLCQRLRRRDSRPRPQDHRAGAGSDAGRRGRVSFRLRLGRLLVERPAPRPQRSSRRRGTSLRPSAAASFDEPRDDLRRLGWI